MSVQAIQSHWDKAMAAYPNQGTDVLASLTQEALNELLTKHHQYDRDRYRIPFSREFPDAGKVRKFKLSIDVPDPFQIFLPPQDAAALPPIFRSATGWTDLPAPSDRSSLSMPNDRAVLRAGTGPMSVGTIWLYCPAFQLSLDWPRFDGGKPGWNWNVPPITVGAEAYLELDRTATEWIVRIRLTRINLEKAQPIALDPKYVALRNSLAPPQQAILQAEEEKFYDLLLIGLNIAATEYAPSMVAAIDIPTFPLGKSKLQPSCLFLDDHILTLGTGLKVQSLAEINTSVVDQAISAFSARLELDIENQGGWDAYLARQTGPNPHGNLTDLARGREISPNDENTLSHEFPLAYAYIDRIRNTPEEVINSTQSSQGHGGSPPGTPPNMAVGINEYILTNLVAQALPKPKNQCEDWKPALDGLVRGRTCNWSNVWGASITINGSSVTGGVNFSFGGEADGCLHVWVPWKCKWEWECASIGIAFKGAPVVTVRLSERPHQGLMFWLEIDAQSIDVDMIAPFPLNVVLSMFAKLIVSFALAIVALVINLTTFQIIPPLIELKGQNTKLEFVGFSAFGYSRPQPLPHPKKTFIGFEASLLGTK